MEGGEMLIKRLHEFQELDVLEGPVVVEICVVVDLFQPAIPELLCRTLVFLV